MFLKCSIKDINVELYDATGDATRLYSRAHKKICLLLIIICCSLKATAQHTITISFKNMVGNQPLNTDSIYTNQFGEPFKIRNCRYYISNIVLLDSLNSKSQSFNDQYFLVDEKEDESKHIALATSLQHITGLQFLLGVDSIKNVSGVQTGSLDPARGMFWTWNTGYVMAKLEGTSPVAKTPGHAFSYHVGGYKPGEAVAKKIQLAVQEPLALHRGYKTIFITADILKWFSNKYTIKIADVTFCHEPGKLAMQLADNYAGMFSIESVE
ncbi:hypothetical protein BH10BAC2_BH10BAC2_06820 [soil metagenome]